MKCKVLSKLTGYIVVLTIKGSTSKKDKRGNNKWLICLEFDH